MIEKKKIYVFTISEQNNICKEISFNISDLLRISIFY